MSIGRFGLSGTIRRHLYRVNCQDVVVTNNGARIQQAFFHVIPLEAGRGRRQKTGGRAAKGLESDEMVGSFYVVGAASRCKQRISEYREAGVQIPLLLPRLEDYGKIAESLST